MAEFPWKAHYPTQISWDDPIPPSTIVSMLKASAEQRPDAICLDFFDREFSFLEVQQLVDRFTKGLQHIGVKKGTKVGLMLPNTPFYVIAYYAILQCGGMVVNYNPLYSVHELAPQVEDSQTEIIIGLNLKIFYKKLDYLLANTMLNKVIIADIREAMTTLKKILFSVVKFNEIESVANDSSHILFEDLLQHGDDYQEIEIQPEDVALLQYTGGTTGKSKGAVLTHQSLYANVVQISRWFHTIEGEKEVYLAVLPFFHVFAMTCTMNLCISLGIKMVLHPKFELSKLLNDVQKKKITLLAAVPAIFNAINHADLKGVDLSSLRLCISGGAPLPQATRESFEALSGSKLVEGYGLTETSPVATINVPGDTKQGSIGFPLPQTIIEIRDKETKVQVLPYLEIGELCIKGPQTMKEYYNNEEETSRALKDGWVFTGDLGYMDDQGYVYVVDRLKDMIICNGYNVYPRKIEELLYKLSGVQEAAVVGIDHEEKGQVPVAFVVVEKDHELTKERILSYLKEQLASFEVPAHVVFYDALPKTLIGKISKKDIKMPEDFS